LENNPGYSISKRELRNVYRGNVAKENLHTRNENTQ
jgi:hypothetical protein